MQKELLEHTGAYDERAEWELGGWLQPQISITLGAMTLGIRLQSALYEDIRTKRRYRNGLCVIQRRRCPLLYGTEPRSFIGSPIDQAEQSKSWVRIMGQFVAGCQRSTCILIYIGAGNRYDPRRSNSTHHLYLATKENMQHYLALAAIVKQSMRITVCSWCLNNPLILLFGVIIFRSYMNASSKCLSVSRRIT